MLKWVEMSVAANAAAPGRSSTPTPARPLQIVHESSAPTTGKKHVVVNNGENVNRWNAA